MVAAVVAGDLAVADAAWHGIEVAFEHQREDGGFEAKTRPNGQSARTGGAAVETAYFFLQELGRAILVIRQSPHESHFHERIAALEPRIRRACDFIAAGYPSIIRNSSHAVNRIIIAAKAFGTCGLVLHDDKLVATSRKLIAHALTLRDKDGVFIENGGRDSSYNVVSIFYGQTLALHVPLPEFDAALPQAVAWQLSKIRDNGEVDVKGNTRTGVGKRNILHRQTEGRELQRDGVRPDLLRACASRSGRPNSRRPRFCIFPSRMTRHHHGLGNSDGEQTRIVFPMG